MNNYFMNSLIKKFNNGDFLDDKELDQLIEHYTLLEILLRHHGKILHLSWRYIWDKLEILKSYKKARKE